MARAPVREVSSPSAIQGVATPVSTYVRPAEPARSSLHDVAEGLAAFDSGLKSFMSGREAATSDDDDKAKAIADFNRNNRMGWAEAVRQGKVPASSSPVYQEWYKRSQGNLAGLKLRDKFALDYQQWGGRNSADSEAFSGFMSDWLSKNIGEDQDPDILKGLVPHLDGLTDSAYSTFLQERENRVKEGARATSGALITDALVDAEEEGAATGKTDYEAFWNKVLELRQDALDSGEMETDWDSYLVGSILLQAETRGDKEILKLLEKKLPGSEHPMSYDPKVREMIAQSSDRIDAKNARAVTEGAAAQEKREKAEQEARWAEVVTRIHKGEDVPEEMIVELSRRDGEARHKIAKYRQEFGNMEVEEDPEALLDLYTEIYQGAGIEHVLKRRDEGVIKNPSTLTKALDLVKTVKGATADGGIFTSPTYKDTVRLVTSLTGDGKFSPLGEPGLTSEGTEALYDYRQMLLEWEVKNPNASMLEKEKAAREIGDIIRSRIQGDALSGGQYISEADRQKQAQAEAAGAAQQPPAVQEPQQPQATPGAALPGYGAIPNPIQSFRDMIGAWFGEEPAPQAQPQAQQPQEPAPAAPAQSAIGESPERRQAAEDFAKRKGITVEEADTILQQRIQKLMGTEAEPAVDPTITNSVSEESRAGLNQLFENPPQVQLASLSSSYVDPKKNPSVATAVLERFAGGRLPVSIRNNNMGAISITGDIDSSWAAKQPGFVGTTKRPKAEGGYYAKFATPEHGVAAASKLLERYGERGINTPSEIVKKWSADTTAHDAYARTLSKYLNEAGFEAGVDTALDLTDPQVRIAVLKAKSAHESGAGIPVYADEVFSRGAAYQIDTKPPRKRGRGLEALAPNGLVASNKRGYEPDLERLRPEIRSGVEQLQAKWGRALPIVSGYRDEKRNKKAGGADKSQHKDGNAVDIDVSDLSKEERIELIRMASESGFTGIGVYTNSLHLDYGTRRYWGPDHHGESLPKWASAAIRDHMSRT